MGGYDLRHGLGVAARVDGLDAKIVAILHDAIEDDACTVYDLAQSELPREVLDAVTILTRRPDRETYAEYIERVRRSGSRLAVTVKLADLHANLGRLDEQRASLEARYRNAIQTLKAAKGRCS